MSLFIRDPEVRALAVEVQRAIGAPTKTEAVRIALQHELDNARRKVPLRNRIAKVQAMADQIGIAEPDSDQKAFFDEMWDGL